MVPLYKPLVEKVCDFLLLIQKFLSGSVMPIDLLNMKTDWSCNLCGKIMTTDEVKGIMKDLEAEAKSLRRDDISTLKSLIMKYSGKLHKNHTLLIELKQLLVSGKC